MIGSDIDHNGSPFEPTDKNLNCWQNGIQTSCGFYFGKRFGFLNKRKKIEVDIYHPLNSQFRS
jgi:hypothetical protein